MAKQRWLVRMPGHDGEYCSCGPDFSVYVGKKPEKRYGSWQSNQESQTIPKEYIRALFYPTFHLEPGGGPVLLGCW